MTLMPPSKMSVLEESVQLDNWGVFDFSGLTGEIHTAPIYKNGIMRIHHTFSKDCACKPSIEYSGRILIHHNDLWS